MRDREDGPSLPVQAKATDRQGVVSVAATDDAPEGASQLYKILCQIDNYSKQRFAVAPRIDALIDHEVLQDFSDHVKTLYQLKVEDSKGVASDEFMVFKFLDITFKIEELNPKDNVFFTCNGTLCYIYNVTTGHCTDLWDQAYLALPRSRFAN